MNCTMTILLTHTLKIITPQMLGVFGKLSLHSLSDL